MKTLPTQIAKIRREMLSLGQQLTKINDRITEIELPIDRQVVFNPDFKNEPQRKIARTEALQGIDEYRELIVAARSLQAQIDELSIDLEFTRNKLSIAKLGKRDEIARLELVA
jgi:hypothetical protein